MNVKRHNRSYTAHRAANGAQAQSTYQSSRLDEDSFSAPEGACARPTGSTQSRKGAPALAGTKRPTLLIPLAIFCVLAVMFIAWEVVFRRLLPTYSIGWHHAFLTLWTGVLTAVVCTGVYAVMYRQQQRLSKTADELTHLLASYKANSDAPLRFENPHLVHCRDVLACTDETCPMYSSPHRRCWQVKALSSGKRDDTSDELTIEQCHGCEVYRRSCPDKLTELGEAFNNLMFLLEEEADQVGRMRSQLVEKEKMVAIGQMAAGIAHEVCNPLSSISSIVQMLKRTRSSTPVTKQLELIETHIQRISTTVRQLVSMARPRAERWELVDVGETAANAIQLIQFDRRARDVEIDFEPPKSLPLTYALQDQLQQVFINLALNALDAMPNGGKLTVNVCEQRGQIVITVRDTGCGIPPGTGRRIFEPFYTTKEPGQGTGLGLAVSYNVIQKLAGTIDFASHNGAGTTFLVRFPVKTEAPDA
ncbi:MAG: sensor histidine kinase [Phycisphaerae bacterium]